MNQGQGVSKDKGADKTNGQYNDAQWSLCPQPERQREMLDTGKKKKKGGVWGGEVNARKRWTGGHAAQASKGKHRFDDKAPQKRKPI